MLTKLKTYVSRWFTKPEPDPEMDSIKSFIEMLQDQTKKERKRWLEFAEEDFKQGKYAQSAEWKRMVFESDVFEHTRNIKDFLFKVAVRLNMRDEYEEIITKKAPGYEEPPC